MTSDLGSRSEGEGLPPYALPLEVKGVEECHFYHTLDLPGVGTVHGPWDLRKNEDSYLGNFRFAGKRVLEVGTASGAICFHIERSGGDVVAYDLSDQQAWDLVPFPHLTLEDYQERKGHIRKLNNGYWFAHRALQSSARVVYGSVYQIPPAIGPVDVTTYCSILLHLRDPFLALARGVRLAKEAVIVVEPYGRMFALRRMLTGLRKMLSGVPILGTPYLRFLPNFRKKGPEDTWWSLGPELLREMLGILGFQDTTLTFHHQLHHGRRIRMFTLVGRRTHEVPLLAVL